MIATELQTTYYDSPVGLLEIKADDEGIHAILFVNAWKGPKLDTEQLSQSTSGNVHINTCILQLKEYFEGVRKSFDFPFSQQGTAFQQKVWAALLDIPYGKTISYMELSKRIGDPKAIRAVGTTNGKNQISIVVPCHRVIGANGSLVGYGGDLWRKKWLLDHEAKFGSGVQTLGGW
ncbi:MAG: methylated-DNA--[protein]-cysteine S-methyltransferase [Chitinophagaceae bacterium]|nr:methylated-DNA--[protein]-cysteine S-methyltransferase [Chitinophagaceae bacterium]